MDQHFQPDGLNIVKGLIFPLLRDDNFVFRKTFRYAENNLVSMFSLNCRRSLFFNSEIPK